MAQFICDSTGETAEVADLFRIINRPSACRRQVGHEITAIAPASAASASRLRGGRGVRHVIIPVQMRRSEWPSAATRKRPGERQWKWKVRYGISRPGIYLNVSITARIA